MKIIILVLFFIVQLVASSNQPSLELNFTYGINLVNNPIISTPIIYPQSSRQYSTQFAGWSTKNLYIQYIDICQSGLQRNYKGIQCGWQVLDTDSIRSNEQYYQNFTLSANRQFAVNFNYISQVKNLYSTGLTVYWNNQQLISFYNDTQTYLSSPTFYVKSIEGTNQLVFQAIGIADSAGIMIRNISLQQIIYPIIKFTNLSIVINKTQYKRLFTMFNTINNLTQFTNMISAKSNFQFLLGYMLQLNHLFLYNFHNHNYTSTTCIILAEIKYFDDQKGFLLDNYIYPYIHFNITKISMSFNRKIKYLTYTQKLIIPYRERQVGYILQFIDTVILDLPVTFLLLAIGYTIFKLIAFKPISLIVCQYSTFTVIILILLQGRIQKLTYYFLSEILSLAANCFFQKIIFTCIIYSFFFILLTGIIGILLLYFYYNKRIFHYLGIFQSSFRLLVLQNFLFGTYSMILGALHWFLLYHPLQQLYSLLLFQCFVLISMIFYFSKKHEKDYLLLFLRIQFHSIRIIFIASILAQQILKLACIEIIQQCIFQGVLVLWGISMIIFFVRKILFFAKVIQLNNNTKKINFIRPVQMNKEMIKIESISQFKKKTIFEQNYHFNLQNSICSKKQILPKRRDNLHKNNNKSSNKNEKAQRKNLGNENNLEIKNRK